MSTTDNMKPEGEKHFPKEELERDWETIKKPDIPHQTVPAPTRYGWTCPRCGGSISPDVHSCPRCQGWHPWQWQQPSWWPWGPWPILC